MIVCPKCKTENIDNAKFCRNCGAQIDFLSKVDFTPSNSIETKNEKAAAENNHTSDGSSLVGSVVLTVLGLIFIGIVMLKSSVTSIDDQNNSSIDVKSEMPLAVVAEEKYKLPSNTIETMDLLKMFAIDKDATGNMYDWSTGAEASSPIKWIDSGIVESLGESSHPYERKGEVYVLNKGKITHQFLEKKMEDGKWSIKLVGARGGYVAVEIEPDMVGAPQLYISKKYLLMEDHCEESATENTSMYLVQFTNKKPFWLKEIYSSGAATGSFYYTIMYDEKPSCDENIQR